MKAGTTNIDVGTVVRVKNTCSEMHLIGLTGSVTHPFGFGETSEGWVGIYLDKGSGIPRNRINMNIEDLEII